MPANIRILEILQHMWKQCNGEYQTLDDYIRDFRILTEDKQIVFDNELLICDARRHVINGRFFVRLVPMRGKKSVGSWMLMYVNVNVSTNKCMKCNITLVDDQIICTNCKTPSQKTIITKKRVAYAAIDTLLGGQSGNHEIVNY
jgi:hypothetical protein